MRAGSSSLVLATLATAVAAHGSLTYPPSRNNHGEHSPGAAPSRWPWPSPCPADQPCWERLEKRAEAAAELAALSSHNASATHPHAATRFRSWPLCNAWACPCP